MCSAAEEHINSQSPPRPVIVVIDASAIVWDSKIDPIGSLFQASFQKDLAMIESSSAKRIVHPPHGPDNKKEENGYTLIFVPLWTAI